MKGGALLVRAATERVLLLVLSVNWTALALVAMVDLVVVVKLALYWYYAVEANRVVLVRDAKWGKLVVSSHNFEFGGIPRVFELN
jgi:hypothetical protein